jgi:hypothetical protein
MLKQIALVFSLHLGMLVTATSNTYSTMKLCPTFKSQHNFDINQVCYFFCGLIYGVSVHGLYSIK